MLQDIEVGRLENEFRNIAASEDDIIICFHEGKVLLSRATDDTLILPTVSCIPVGERPMEPRYIFRMQDRNYFLWTADAPAEPDGFAYEPVRQLRQMKSKHNHY